MRDVHWASFTAHIGFPVVGARRGEELFSAVDRSPSSTLMALATNKAQVVLANYPCVLPQVCERLSSNSWFVSGLHVCCWFHRLSLCVCLCGLFALYHRLGLITHRLCLCSQQETINYSGHADLVGNVRFMHDGRTLLSVGAKDCIVFQWKVVEVSSA